MITFCIALVVLVVGFFTYGKLVERIFGIEQDGRCGLRTDGSVAYLLGAVP